MGSVIGMANASGASTATIKYDSFGNVTSATGAGAAISSSLGSEPRYHGMQLDAVSGLYHVRARTYDARTGRFTSRDPISGIVKTPEANHPYGIANSNPHVWRDPSGLFATLTEVSVGVLAAGILATIALPTAGLNLLNSLKTRRQEAEAIGRVKEAVKGLARRIRPLPNPEEEEVVPVFHGSINAASHIRAFGFDLLSPRTPYVSRDIRAAQDAISIHRFEVGNGGATDPGIIQSDIPQTLFEQVLLPLERPYRGFYPYYLDSSEIPLFSPVERLLFNSHIVR
jgi:RHS repeat-associated protein